MELTASELFERLGRQKPPRVLDVRNTEEFAHWRVEGPTLLDVLNVPYFAFIEDEETAVRKVGAWLDAGRGESLVVVCAKGDSSRFVADVLATKGIPATNLAGGMAAWGLGTTVRPIAAGGPLRAWQILRFGRGCLAYVLAWGEDAIVVDPHRELDIYHQVLATERLRLRAVLETHLHADHVSGAPALARAAGVACHANPLDFAEAAFPVEPIVDRTRLVIGGLAIAPLVPLHTPGHTPGSMSFLVNERHLLTGDTLFVDGVGRPDLGGRAAEWGHELFRTLHGRLAGLSDDVVVLPAHASGLHGLGPGGAIAGRLGDTRRGGGAFGLDEAAFVRQAEAAAGSAPPEYARIRMINLGNHEGGAAPAEAELAELELGRNQCALSRR